MDKANPNWYVKTNFEFRLNGGNTSYVNVLNQNSGVTHFKYNVKELENGKYEHTIEIFIAKELISNWSDTLDVQINYAWKTPNENAYIKSEMLDSRYADWNTDWHSYHKFGALETSYMSLQANLFASKTGLNIIK